MAVFAAHQWSYYTLAPVEVNLSGSTPTKRALLQWHAYNPRVRWRGKRQEWQGEMRLYTNREVTIKQQSAKLEMMSWIYVLEISRLKGRRMEGRKQWEQMQNASTDGKWGQGFEGKVPGTANIWRHFKHAVKEEQMQLHEDHNTLLGSRLH